MLHVGNPHRYDRLPPVEKLLTLVFAMVGKDRATLLRLDYEPDPPDDRVRMWYCVGGRPWEMVPPPGHVWPNLVRILWRNARLPPADRPPWWRRRRRVEFPAGPVFGVLPVRYGAAVVDFDILFFRGRSGQHVWMERPAPADVTAAAADFLRRPSERQ